MIIWPFSDLHLDTTRGWDLPPPSERPRFDVAVCAGDLIPGCASGVRWLAERLTGPVVFAMMQLHARRIVDDVGEAENAIVGMRRGIYP